MVCTHTEITDSPTRPLLITQNTLQGSCFFFFQAEDGIRDLTVTGVQTCALPISFTNLAIAGVGSLSGDSPLTPNMNISLPGVGYVVLNEQIPSGDGVSSSGLTVNMIHVYLQSLVGGILNPLTGQIIGGTVEPTGQSILALA